MFVGCVKLGHDFCRDIAADLFTEGQRLANIDSALSENIYNFRLSEDGVTVCPINYLFVQCHFLFFFFKCSNSAKSFTDVTNGATELRLLFTMFCSDMEMLFIWRVWWSSPSGPVCRLLEASLTTNSLARSWRATSRYAQSPVWACIRNKCDYKCAPTTCMYLFIYFFGNIKNKRPAVSVNALLRKRGTYTWKKSD